MSYDIADTCLYQQVLGYSLSDVHCSDDHIVACRNVFFHLFVFCFFLFFFFFSFFFFQAEDGIRDAQVSRGLGDVYKETDPILIFY